MMVTEASEPATLSVRPAAADAALAAPRPAPPAHFGHAAPSAICVPQTGQKATRASFERRQASYQNARRGAMAGPSVLLAHRLFRLPHLFGRAIRLEFGRDRRLVAPVYCRIGQ